MKITDVHRLNIVVKNKLFRLICESDKNMKKLTEITDLVFTKVT